MKRRSRPWDCGGQRSLHLADVLETGLSGKRRIWVEKGVKEYGQGGEALEDVEVDVPWLSSEHAILAGRECFCRGGL